MCVYCWNSDLHCNGGDLADMAEEASEAPQNRSACSSHCRMRSPLFAKLLAICIISYALCPIDLIPDFIPILGYLDDLILVPLGILLLLKLMPEDVLADARSQAKGKLKSGSTLGSKIMAGVVVLIWIVTAICALTWMKSTFYDPLDS